MSWLAVVGGIVWISGYRRWRSTQWSWDLQGTSWERWGRQDHAGIHLYSLIDCMLLLVYILSRDKWMSTLTVTTELFTMQQQPLSSLLGFVEIIPMIIMTDYSNIVHPYTCSPLDPYKQACFLLILSCMTINLPSQSVRSQASQHIQKPSQCKNAS